MYSFAVEFGEQPLTKNGQYPAGPPAQVPVNASPAALPRSPLPPNFKNVKKVGERDNFKVAHYQIEIIFRYL